MKSLSSPLALSAMTPMERRVGRFLRAPDHDASTPAPAADPAPIGDTPSAAEPAPAGDLAPVDVDDGDDSALGGKLPDAGEPDAGDKGDEAPVVPEAYTLTAPEGMTLDAELVEAITPTLKELSLTNEQADKLMPFAGQLVEKTVANIQTQMIDAGNAQRKAWLDASKAAEDIGGNKWDASMHSAARGLDALGYTEGSEFRAFLTETGIGNHPDMIRIAAKLGELVAEDGEFVRADAGAQVKRSREEVLYPDDVRKEGA